MKLTREQQAVVQALIEQQGTNLRRLAEIAGIDPATGLLGADFRGADFGTDDLSGFNLSRADLRGADLSRARGLDRAMFADAIQDHRTRWPQRRQPLPGSVMRDGPDLPEMVLIPPGRFLMGTPPEEDAREKMPEEFAGQSKRQHTVTFRRGFWLAKYPVTRAEFAAFVADSKRDMSGEAGGWVEGKGWQYSDQFSWQNPGFSQTDRDPVVCVDLADIDAYRKWLSDRTGRRYRLPSEAEWEYAVRAGTTTARFWGDDRDGARRYANVADRGLAKRLKQKFDRERFFPWDDGYPFTSPVGAFQPNPFGLCDMLGNVWEWVADHWHDSYDGAPDDGSPWTTQGSEGRRVLRGGSSYFYPRFLRAGVRNWIDPDSRYNYAGFRLARTL